MKTTKGLIHAVFECLDCGERWEDFTTAQEKAREHARKHKHVVQGDTGFGVTYDGKQ